MRRIEHRRFDPFSPPAWRWETAGEILKGMTRWNHEVDQAVMAAVALRAAHDKPGDRDSQRRIPPALVAALAGFGTQLAARTYFATVSRSTSSSRAIFRSGQFCACKLRIAWIFAIVSRFAM